MFKKSIFCVSILSVILCGCAGASFSKNGLEHSREPRTNAYHGQPAADILENFGNPTKIERLSASKQILIYEKQEVEKEWAYRYLRECVMKFYLEDNRLVDWTAQGNMCVINGAKEAEKLELDENIKFWKVDTEGGLFDLFSPNEEEQNFYENNNGGILEIPAVNDEIKKEQILINGEVIPDDAFE